jgi:hypothetical protein
MPFHARGAVLACFIVLLAAGVRGANSERNVGAEQPRDNAGEQHTVIVIQSYAKAASAVRSANPDVKLSVERDAAMPDQLVLSVTYPGPTGNPAGRDVWCDAERTDWTAGKAIRFQAKSEHPMRLSMSFMDRNRVAYTTWIDLAGDDWQPVRVAFDAIRPNPFFQPPGAKKDAPIDVGEVARIGFGTQDQSAGRFTLSRLVVVD